MGAPQWQWAKALASVSSYVQTSVTEPNTGNTYVAGSFVGTTSFGNQTFTANGVDGFLVKHDAQGNIIWGRQIGGRSDNEVPSGIALDASGNTYVVGTLSSSITLTPTTVLPPSNPGNNLYVVKYDPTGAILWARCFGSSGSVAGEVSGRAVAVSPTGVVYIAAQLKGGAQFDAVQLENSIGAGPVLLQLSPNGSVNWASAAAVETTETTPISSGETYKLGFDASGSPYLGGSFAGKIRFGSHTVTAPTNTGAVFLVRYDAQGNPQWAAQSATSSKGHVSLEALRTDAAGNTYLTGTFTNDSKTNTGVNFGSYALNSAGEGDVYLVKYNPAGAPLWAHSFGSKKYDRGNALLLMPSGSVLLGGGVAGTATVSPELTLSGLNEWDLYAFVISFTEQGDVQWSHQAKGSSLINSLTNDQAGNLYLGGQGGYNTVFGNLPSLTINSGYGFIARLGNAVLNTKASHNAQSLAVYPSLTTSAADVQLGALPKGTTLYLSDALGRVMCQQTVGSEPTHLALPSLRAGLYALKATAPNGEYYTGRLVVE
ncbi:hypothetical protein BXP70_13770 [Hymenobacter crusticola]|uniref:Secretion system C-terminal sorting domain-containing protein n=1 Tax=Hymenobacter crusticola TaxID=1770526 RepID=A0A243WCT4_9BACT|nr:hypothetical protein BXP70_13770 [Hymenobacter crusticola]